MTPYLLSFLCDPITGKNLILSNAVYDTSGNIVSGILYTENNNEYPIIDGIPRFIKEEFKKSVDSFGDEWNYFNFTDFKANWLFHTVKSTFGNTDVFKDKIIVDAGAGSGSQSLWFLEYGASHVIILELSHSVDGVIRRNIGNYSNVDIIQCSIDAPPIKKNSIPGIVYCHNVIQHTPSVEKTAKALYDIVAPPGEFVFNCYPLNDKGFFRWIRYHIIYKGLRAFLSKMPFSVIMFYSKTVSLFRLIPGIGYLLEMTNIAQQGDVPIKVGENWIARLRRRYKNCCLNTFDSYGSHSYQHHKSDNEIMTLVKSLQPNLEHVKNIESYFQRPKPIGCALRIFKQ